jgi:hypothetical protein
MFSLSGAPVLLPSHPTSPPPFLGVLKGFARWLAESRLSRRHQVLKDQFSRPLTASSIYVLLVLVEVGAPLFVSQRYQRVCNDVEHLLQGRGSLWVTRCASESLY